MLTDCYSIPPAPIFMFLQLIYVLVLSCVFVWVTHPVSCPRVQATSRVGVIKHFLPGTMARFVLWFIYLWQLPKSFIRIQMNFEINMPVPFFHWHKNCTRTYKQLEKKLQDGSCHRDLFLELQEPKISNRKSESEKNKIGNGPSNKRDCTITCFMWSRNTRINTAIVAHIHTTVLYSKCIYNGAHKSSRSHNNGHNTKTESTSQDKTVKVRENLFFSLFSFLHLPDTKVR